MKNEYRFTWGDEVQVRTDAPIRYRPEAFASVCGMGTISTESQSEAFGFPVGTKVYTIEYSDGSSLQAPEELLEPVPT